MKIPLGRHAASGTVVPNLPPSVAAASAGLVVAVLGIVLVMLGEKGCDAVLGTPSCGGAGVLLLVVTAAAMVYAGYRLLDLLRVPDPALTSVFGFSLFAIVLMTALLDDIFSAYTWVVLPVLGAVTYAVGSVLSQGLNRLSG